MHDKINDMLIHLNEIRKDLFEQVASMLMDYDRELTRYEEDIYLYYDEETHTATLSLFVNPGGSSWLDDDHFLLYRMRPETHPIDVDPDDIDDYIDCFSDDYYYQAEGIFDKLQQDLTLELEWIIYNRH